MILKSCLYIILDKFVKSDNYLVIAINPYCNFLSKSPISLSNFEKLNSDISLMVEFNDSLYC